jgi:flagellar hook-associated protein 2
MLNGLLLNQSTNQLQNAISGTTMNLTKAEKGKIISLTIDDNKDQLTNSVNDFVKKYNDSMTFLTKLTGYNSDTKERGIYQSDPQFRNLKLNLNKWATSPINNNSAIRGLVDLGIKTNKQGLLELNQDKFNSALSNHYADIGALFAKSATATDSNIRINPLTNRVKAGTYNVDLTQYTPGVSMTGTIGSSAATTSSDGITLYGSGDLSSLSIQVLAGSSGPRGQISVTDGIAVQMNQLLDSYMSSQGDLNQRSDQLNQQLTQLTKSQAEINTRSTNVEARYLKQFNSLDLLLSKMQATSASLTNLLNKLP